MDQSELLTLVAEGKEAWNEWVDANPNAKVDFSGVEFDNDVTFEGFRFQNDAYFSGATFTGEANFSVATFSGEANFMGATFARTAAFCNTTFSGEANFSVATFSGEANFSVATFAGTAYFSEATFARTAAFFNTTFSGTAVFFKTIFSSNAQFNYTTFTGYVSFVSIDVEGTIQLEDAKFHRIPDFHAAKNPERIALDTVEFVLPKPSGRLNRIVYWATGLCGSDRSTMIRIRQIRGIANKNHAIDTERDLTILERNAQAGAAWSGLKKLRPFKQWWMSLLTVLYSTPLLLAYRWSSSYGRSIKLPLFWLFASPFVWYVIYLKLYINYKLLGSLSLSSLKLSALQDFTVTGWLPIGTALRPTYIVATKTLFGESGNLPLQFQIASLLQSVTSLIFLFLIGLALRNFFRMK